VLKLCYHKEGNVKGRLNSQENKPLSKNRDPSVNKTKAIGSFMQNS
jgi:hypothetical protein